jgi:hypothetical protein
MERGIYSRAMCFRSPGSSVLTALMYAAVVTWLPIHHAMAEVLSAQASVESEHSRQCPRIHAVPACMVGGGTHIAPPAEAQSASFAPPAEDRPAFQATHRLSSSPFRHSHRSRAPPTR